MDGGGWRDHRCGDGPLFSMVGRGWLCCRENMLIASTALGYGSCWLEGYTLRWEEEFKVLLDIPKEKRLLTLVPIGVPTEWPAKEKRPLEEVIHWERY